MKFIPAEDLTPSRREVELRLGSCSTEGLEEVLESVLRKLRTAIRCCYCYRESTVEVVGDTCRFSFGEVQSRSLSKYMEGAERVYALAVTLGHGADNVIRQAGTLGAFREFCTDAVASALIEAAADAAQAELPCPTRSRFSPGYGDYEISGQRELLRFLETEKKIGVRLSESCLMVPTKSISAIVRIVEHE